MSSLRIAAVAAALTVGFGCGDTSSNTPSSADAGFSTPDTGVDGMPPSVELGAGLTAYRALPLDSSDEVELVMGAQGGWHIDLGVRVRGFQPGDMSLLYTAASDVQVFAEVLFDVPAGRKFLPTQDGWVRSGDRVIFSISDPSEVVGQQIDISVALQVGALELMDDRRIVIVDNE